MRTRLEQLSPKSKRVENLEKIHKACRSVPWHMPQALTFSMTRIPSGPGAYVGGTLPHWSMNTTIVLPECLDGPTGRCSAVPSQSQFCLTGRLRQEFSWVSKCCSGS